MSRESLPEPSEPLRVGPSELLSIDFSRREIRVVPTEQFAAEALHALPHAQAASRALANEAGELRAALCELHRAVTESDGSGLDQARLYDAICEAQKLAPYEPEESDPFGC